MDVNIRIEQGRCHECGYEYVILSHKMEHPKELKVPGVARCPECNAEQPITFGSRRQFVRIPDDSIGRLSEALLQDTKCTRCSKALPLLLGERADLVFKMEKAINAAEGLVEEWTNSVPFCRHCMEHESEEALINASRKFLESEKEENSEEILTNAKRTWKY